MNMKKMKQATTIAMAGAVVIALALASVGCGGAAAPGARAAAAVVALPLPEATLTSESMFDASMIGQVWEFENGFGDACQITVEDPAALTRTEADGSVTEITWTDPERRVAGHDGSPGMNVVLHYTKPVARCYWLLGVDGAELWFVLHRMAAPDGHAAGWRSTASLIRLPKGCPWCGVDGQPTTDKTLVTYNIADTQPGMAPAYMIAPPTMRSNDPELRVESRAMGFGVSRLTLDALVPEGTLAGPHDGEYFAAYFRVGWVRKPDYSVVTDPAEMNACTEGRQSCVLAVISNQYEAVCGHEVWIWVPGLGIARVESPNDGGEVKNNPVCATSGNQPGFDAHDSRLTIVRKGGSGS